LGDGYAARCPPALEGAWILAGGVGGEKNFIRKRKEREYEFGAIEGESDSPHFITGACKKMASGSGGNESKEGRLFAHSKQ
jgi:hypothetical protein